MKFYFNSKYTKEAGFLSYYEICDKLKQGWTRSIHTEHQVPFAYFKDQWIGYDDIESLKLKAKYIIDNNLAGAMFWSLDSDDFSGKHCDQGKYPLINAVKNVFNQKFDDLSTIAPTTTSTSTPSTTPLPTTTTIIYNAKSSKFLDYYKKPQSFIKSEKYNTDLISKLKPKSYYENLIEVKNNNRPLVKPVMSFIASKNILYYIYHVNLFEY